MSVSGFIPEIWSAALLDSLKKSQVFAGLANRDYEGEIADQGDTVHITSIGRPTISTYVPNVTVITPEQLQTADRTLVIDQSKFFAFEVDDVDKRQVRGNLIDKAMQEAAFGMSDVADTFLSAAMAGAVQASNVIADTVVATGDAAYTQLAQLGRKLSEANVPQSGRWAVLPPWYVALLLDTNKVAWNAGVPALAQAAAVNGFIGRLLGFDLFESNNCPITGTGGIAGGAGNDTVILAGTTAAMSYAEQVSKTEAYRPQSSFADAIKGLHLYGGKVVRPDGLAAGNFRLS